MTGIKTQTHAQLRYVMLKVANNYRMQFRPRHIFEGYLVLLGDQSLLDVKA